MYRILIESGDALLIESGSNLLIEDSSTNARKPGFQDGVGNRNKRESRFGYEGANDVSYRLGDRDMPSFGTIDNKNRNRYS